jgi:hypothetical protein
MFRTKARAEHRLPRHNNINKANIILITVDIYNLFLYNYPHCYKLF